MSDELADLRAEVDRLREVLKLESERAEGGWQVVEAVQEAVRALVTPERVPMPLETNLIEALGKIGEWIDEANVKTNGVSSESIQND
jgi:hypothetical protein